MLTPVANASNIQSALPEYSFEPQHSLYRKVRNYGTVVCSAVADPAGAMAKIVAAFDIRLQVVADDQHLLFYRGGRDSAVGIIKKGRIRFGYANFIGNYDGRKMMRHAQQL